MDEFGKLVDVKTLISVAVQITFILQHFKVVMRIKIRSN